MAQGWEQCESLLRRMAESMGFMVVAEPATAFAGSTWHVAKRLDSRQLLRLTIDYFSPVELLGRMLHYYRTFNLCGQIVDNPFFGASPEEAELRLAVMGA